jgi:hypothetical protein
MNRIVAEISDIDRQNDTDIADSEAAQGASGKKAE